MTTGYELKIKNKKVIITKQPNIYRKTKLSQHGPVKLKWTAIKKARSYSLLLREVDRLDLNATHIGALKSSAIVTGLESGKRYLISVRANSRRNSGPESKAITIYEVGG
ncbi:MAG: fibronectin type III domain-containing protein [Bacteroidetes bacterium]|nr:fibronectin type III domain-containing protein [Bacteroidota bacterium]